MWLNLGKVLDDKGMSAREFSKKIGLPRTEVSRYFRQGYNPRFSQIFLWAEALECEVTDFLDPTLSHEEMTMPRPQTAVRAIIETAARVKEIEREKRKASLKKKKIVNAKTKVKSERAGSKAKGQ